MSARVLVVAPEGPAGSAVCELLRGMRPHWEILTATSAPSARAVCGVLPVDVVVVDAGTHGAAALLRDLAATRPTIGRVALAALREQSIALPEQDRDGVAPEQHGPRGDGAWLAAHRVLPRSPAGYLLIRAIAAARAEAAATQLDPVDRIVADLDVLPPAPLVWTRLRSMLAEPGSDLPALTAVISQDVAAAVMVLRIANGAGLGPSARPVADVSDAIRLLGVRTVASALLAPQVLAALRHVRPLPGLRLHELSQHGFACGVVARQLLNDPQQAAQAFLGGLLQDVGQLALALRQTTAYRSCLAEAGWRDRSLHEVERASFGFDHAAVGGALLRRWNLPGEVAAAVACSHKPLTPAQQAGTDPLGVSGAVRLAHCLVTTNPGRRGDIQERAVHAALAAEAQAAVDAHHLAGVADDLLGHPAGRTEPLTSR